MTVQINFLANMYNAPADHYFNLFPLGADLYAVSGGDGAGGDCGLVTKWDGAAWSSLGGETLTTGHSPYAFANGTDIWACLYPVYIGDELIYKFAAGVWVNMGVMAAFPLATGFYQLGVSLGGEPHYWVEYAGGASGQVIKYNGLVWVTVTSVQAFTICSMGVMAGALYLLRKSNGALYVVGGGTCVAVTDAAAVGGKFVGTPQMAVVGGEIYYANSSLFADSLAMGALFKWDGVSAWGVLVPYTGGGSLNHVSLFPYAGALYACRVTGGYADDLYGFPGLTSEAVAATLADSHLREGVALGGRTYLLGAAGSGLQKLFEVVPAVPAGPAPSLMMPLLLGGL